jgi:hypothetical protein
MSLLRGAISRSYFRVLIVWCLLIATYAQRKARATARPQLSKETFCITAYPHLRYRSQNNDWGPPKLDFRTSATISSIRIQIRWDPKSNCEGPQLHIYNFVLVRSSAIDPHVRHIADVRTKVAYAHLGLRTVVNSQVFLRYLTRKRMNDIFFLTLLLKLQFHVNVLIRDFKLFHFPPALPGKDIR